MPVLVAIILLWLGAEMAYTVEQRSVRTFYNTTCSQEDVMCCMENTYVGTGPVGMQSAPFNVPDNTQQLFSNS